ncbi:hypothetical protein GCM10010399_54360 [Dactylosporangium fulvum]|uniref:TetR/AcrR family transcriptional regulator n=1 Tax=Dactylosporangium fulvum TaxID=53359 RepID=A0ABY5WD64_9ACTN|nr:TetR/AcrR family transcriptional regulator [Dactylosporangium fulvum]UWP87519.1 TetR/AcrR family transcriptional regulator [Dactylosporangium fulvum]
MTVVKSGRGQHSPRRAEQAAATRAAIIDAAGRLFAAQGYAATTVAAIAEEAGVTAKSVYTLADKPRLLLLAVTEATGGMTPDTTAVLDAPDPAARVRAVAHTGARTLLRLYPIHRAFEQAAAAEPALREPWQEHERHRRARIKKVVRAVAGAGGLRQGLTVGRATDTLWALVTWHAVALLVEERGWGRAKLAAWLEDVLAALLLEAEPA